jgi:hypothetical protein
MDCRHLEQELVMQRRRYSKGLLGSLLLALAAVASTIPAVAQDATTGGGTSLRGPSEAPTTTAPAAVSADKIRKSRRVAYMMARYEWLDKVAEADPLIIAAICERPGPARILAQHRHIDKLAEADHYLCRRLTRWKGAAEQLVRNMKCDRVIALDPEGIYYAMDRDPHIATVLAGHVRFDEMMMTNPDLGRAIAQHSYHN